MSNFEGKIEEALANPSNQGAFISGPAGSGKTHVLKHLTERFEKDGKKVIDRASFQAFGCQTAIAVASIATQLLKGKTAEEARQLSAQELAGDLGTLPPMKIHCGQLVEGALRNALDPGENATTAPKDTLLGNINSGKPSKIRIVPLEA